jgi:hypothetical protein
MAVLNAAFKLRGNLGNLSYYTDKRGRNIVRSKGGPKKKAILHNPQFERTREVITDFGSASHIASQISRAFLPHMQFTSDGNYFNRLVGLVRCIQKTDQINVQGTKSVHDGNVYLLEDFQFNANRSFSHTLNTEYTAFVDKATAKTILQFASFSPLTAVTAPRGATHFQLLGKSTIINTEGRFSSKSVKAGPLLPLSSKETGVIEIELALKTVEDGMHITGAGIIFYQEEAEIPLSMRDGAFAIVRIERIETNPEDRTGKPSAEERLIAAERCAQMIAFASAALVKEHLPILYDDKQRQHYIDKVAKLGHDRWLKKLEKYRKG